MYLIQESQVLYRFKGSVLIKIQTPWHVVRTHNVSFALMFGPGMKTGVTDGTLMKGVRFFGEGARTSSLVMRTNPHRIRFIDTIHLNDGANLKVRF